MSRLKRKCRSRLRFLCRFVSKACRSRGSCTHRLTVWLQSPSAVMDSSVPSCYSLSCSFLSSSPLQPVSGRWIRVWASPCSCSTLSSWCLAWCWRIASLSALFPSERVNRNLHLWPEAEQLTHTCTDIMSMGICRNCAESYCSCSALLPVTSVWYVNSNTHTTIFSRTCYILIFSYDGSFYIHFFDYIRMQDV